MSKHTWIGGDLSSGSIDCAVASDGEAFDRTSKVHRFERTAAGDDAFVLWVASLEGIDGMCIESTGRLSIKFLLEVGPRLPAPVSIVEPSRPRQFAKSLGIKLKNDSADARILAQFGMTTQPKPTVLPERTWRELKECSRLREILRDERKRHEQRLNDGPECIYVQDELQRQIDYLTTRIAALDVQCARLLDATPEALEIKKHAMSIPGVGIQTATTLLAELGDLREYKRSGIVGYAGLYPVEFTSGTSVYKAPHLVKGGGSRLRAVLFMAALSARHHCPHLKTFADRLANEGKEKMVVLGAVMRKLLLLIRALAISGRDYDPTFQHGL